MKALSVNQLKGISISILKAVGTLRDKAEIVAESLIMGKISQ